MLPIPFGIARNPEHPTKWEPSRGHGQVLHVPVGMRDTGAAGRVAPVAAAPQRQSVWPHDHSRRRYTRRAGRKGRRIGRLLGVIGFQYAWGSLQSKPVDEPVVDSLRCIGSRRF